MITGQYCAIASRGLIDRSCCPLPPPPPFLGCAYPPRLSLPSLPSYLLLPPSPPPGFFGQSQPRPPPPQLQRTSTPQPLPPFPFPDFFNQPRTYPAAPAPGVRQPAVLAAAAADFLLPAPAGVPASRFPQPAATSTAPVRRLAVSVTGTPAARHSRLQRSLGPAAQDAASPFAVHAEGSALEDIFLTAGAVIEAGVPDSTLLKDDLA